MQSTNGPCERFGGGNLHRPTRQFAPAAGVLAQFAVVFVVVFVTSFGAEAQALPTAVQRLEVSAFGGVSGVYTGLNSGRNLGVTAGVDLGLQPIFSVSPTLEVRGRYAIDKGRVDSQKHVMAGVSLARYFGRVRPYGDVFFGRGQIQYGEGYVNPAGTLLYVQSNSNVLAGGGGVDVRLDRRFGIKLDGQVERYKTPVTASGHLYAKVVTLGVVYHFRFGPKSPR